MSKQKKSHNDVGKKPAAGEVP